MISHHRPAWGDERQCKQTLDYTLYDQITLLMEFSMINDGWNGARERNDKIELEASRWALRALGERMEKDEKWALNARWTSTSFKMIKSGRRLSMAGFACEHGISHSFYFSNSLITDCLSPIHRLFSIAAIVKWRVLLSSSRTRCGGAPHTIVGRGLQTDDRRAAIKARS